MGHDIYAHRTGYSHEMAPSEYLRMNMHQPSAPLYQALNAYDEAFGGVSGCGEVVFTQDDLLTAIKNYSRIFKEYLKAENDKFSNGKDNFSFASYPKKVSYSGEEWTDSETKDFYVYTFADCLEFLTRCLALLKKDTDTITIDFS